ncbi:hypothetical protein pdam_00010205 [Pocillopora damicornis]|uniref:MI domain-containing protein n=1 Tax=Pocillopora damicornis TaxID=46731 RepID=A0A3M6T461_POCDA|nr:hypothetical protein pdam_00010205 [Pocillopora damicornis]
MAEVERSRIRSVVQIDMIDAVAEAVRVTRLKRGHCLSLPSEGLTSCIFLFGRRKANEDKENIRRSDDDDEDEKEYHGRLQQNDERYDNRNPAEKKGKYDERREQPEEEGSTEKTEEPEKVVRKKANTNNPLLTRTAYQRISWEALKKSINGLVNKAASPTFTHVYAALVAILNTKVQYIRELHGLHFPKNGELLLRRLVLQFRRAYRRNDKAVCLSSTRFIAHLVNQQVAHEILALEILTLLLHKPTDDSVEVAIGFLKEVGMKLTEVSSRAVFERLRNILHNAEIDKRVQYMIEVMFAVRKDGFKDHVAVPDELDLVEEEDQITHLLRLEEASNPEDILNVFKFDPNFLENEEKYKEIRRDDKKMEIIDHTETNLVALRRTIYLTIQSSLDYEECAHKLLKMQIKPEQMSEFCTMVIDCCSQQRSYEKFFGLLAQRFCQLNKEYMEEYLKAFQEQIDDDLETSYQVGDIVWLKNHFHGRVFIKILFQELAEYLGLPKLNERLKDPFLAQYFEGIFPRDNPRNTRFSINFFTSIGLGGITDELREHLKNAPKMIMSQQRPGESDSDSDSSDDSDSEDSSSSEDSSEESPESSEDSSDDDRKKKRHKKKHSSRKKKKESNSKKKESDSKRHKKRR